MKYVVCIPDGCADEPLEELGGLTPLAAAATPTLDALAGRGTVGRAEVIPAGMPPGSDVGNMAILGYEPSRFHTGRAPIEAAALGLRLGPDRTAFRCNLVTVSSDGTMVDFTGGHPPTEQAAEIIEAIDDALGGEVAFHPGVQYRHSMIAPSDWADAECVPPHDITGEPIVEPTGPAGSKLSQLMDASKEIIAGFDTRATQIWLWGQGFQPRMEPFVDHHGVTGGLVTAVDLVRGLGVLTEMHITEVPGATAWYDTDYEGKRDAALDGLSAGLDLFVIHVEATDEAGHAGDIEEKVRALENWDRRILAELVAGLDDLGRWRLLLLPDHATPLRTGRHTSDPVPYLLVDSVEPGPGGVLTEAYVAGSPPVPGHQLLGQHLLV